MNDAFSPSMNQNQKKVEMLNDLHSWAKYIPVWAWWTLARLRPIIMRGGSMKPEEEEMLFKVWKATNWYKSKGVIPPSEDKPFKKKAKEFYGS